MRLLAPATLTILRYGSAVTYGTDGRPLAITPTPVAMRGSVTPASKQVITHTPEGIRVSRMVDLYTYAEVRAADEEAATEADRFVFEGKTYEVQDVTRCPAFMGEPAHWEAYAIQVASLTQPAGVSP